MQGNILSRIARVVKNSGFAPCYIDALQHSFSFLCWNAPLNWFEFSPLAVKFRIQWCVTLTDSDESRFDFSFVSTASVSDIRQQTTDSRPQTADSRQHTAHSRQHTAHSRQQTADSRQQTADSTQHTDDADTIIVH